MAYSLSLISRERCEQLNKTQPKQLHAQILGQEVTGELVIVDRQWEGRLKAVEIQVDDWLYVPSPVISEKTENKHHLHRVREDATATIFRGLTPGLGRLYNPETGWNVFVKVARKEFTGLSIYRHYEEVDDEPDNN